ncbi:hypothetical protein EYZ49_17485 [Salmonella enterica subsp. salamae serovar 13,22:z:-]|uniref:hypothetical protein n=1 Tax=Salmonella enterica TaxID=28901 RepID=UPI00103482B1|nr:hypothetical protein [Salmonella enterica]TBN97389.1 hypothetical protein EYZ49_17485 [Salmonella enterica subsp. salamae serovar 13,22:z:-]HEC9537439.1 hypothetical protein [Salmonella enterica subsp. enterica serovar Poona]
MKSWLWRVFALMTLINPLIAAADDNLYLYEIDMKLELYEHPGPLTQTFSKTVSVPLSSTPKQYSATIDMPGKALPHVRRLYNDHHHSVTVPAGFKSFVQPLLDSGSEIKMGLDFGGSDYAYSNFQWNGINQINRTGWDFGGKSDGKSYGVCAVPSTVISADNYAGDRGSLKTMTSLTLMHNWSNHNSSQYRVYCDFKYKVVPNIVSVTLEPSVLNIHGATGVPAVEESFSALIQSVEFNPSAYSISAPQIDGLKLFLKTNNGLQELTAISPPAQSTGSARLDFKVVVTDTSAGKRQYSVPITVSIV